MPIEFHCEHCGKMVRATELEAGQTGKCPHCKGRTYIPLPAQEIDEIPLAPIDEGEEQRRRRAAAEDAAIQMKLLRDRARERDPTDKPAFKRVDAPGPGTGVPASPATGKTSATSRKHLTGVIVSYIEAMSTGNLERADKLAAELSEDRRTVAGILEELLTEDLSAYGLPVLPKPVLVGYLKRLRGQM